MQTLLLRQWNDITPNNLSSTVTANGKNVKLNIIHFQNIFTIRAQKILLRKPQLDLT